MAYIPSGPDEERFLKEYDPTKYRNPAVAADTALFAVDEEGLSVLLIRRGNYPYKGRWALPGGFVEIEEDIFSSAARELMEEAGLVSPYIEQVFVWGKPDRDPRYRIITVSYAGLVDRAQVRAHAGDDASEADWFRLSGYESAQENGMIVIRYTLSGCETLRPVVTYPKGQIQKIAPVDSGGLAFDHAESIAYSLEYVRRRAREGLLELSFGDDERLKALASKALKLEL
ncbi:MAG: NUDIX hydrolase [Christensenellaceae bacterium]|nr:NUDIX hydrolase [Christensenellaceae bacterium]